MFLITSFTCVTHIIKENVKYVYCTIQISKYVYISFTVPTIKLVLRIVLSHQQMHTIHSNYNH